MFTFVCARLSYDIRFDPAILWMGLIYVFVGLSGLGALGFVTVAILCPVWNALVTVLSRTHAAIWALCKPRRAAARQGIVKRVNTRSRKNTNAAPTFRASATALMHGLWSVLCTYTNVIKRAIHFFVLTIAGCLGAALLALNALFLTQSVPTWLGITPLLLVCAWMRYNDNNQRAAVDVTAVGEVASAIVPLSPPIAAALSKKIETPIKDEKKERKKKGKKGNSKVDKEGDKDNKGMKEGGNEKGAKQEGKEGEPSATATTSMIKAREGPQHSKDDKKDEKKDGHKDEKKEGEPSPTTIKKREEPQHTKEASPTAAGAPAARSASAGPIAEKTEPVGDNTDNGRKAETPAPATAAVPQHHKKPSQKKLVKNNGKKKGGATANRRSAFPDTTTCSLKYVCKYTDDNDVRADAAARLALATMQLALLASLRSLSLFGGRENLDINTAARRTKNVSTQTATGHHTSVSTCSTATDDATIGRDASLSTSTIANDAAVNGREAALSLSSSVEDGKSPTDAALWNEAKKVTALLGEQLVAANVQSAKHAEEFKALQALYEARIESLEAELKEERARHAIAA